MIYFLQLGERKPASFFPNIPTSLSEWVAPVALGESESSGYAHDFGVSPTPALLPGEINGNARAYRRVHLELLAGHAGIDELLFDQGGYGLLAASPDLVVLRPEHAEELDAALRSWRDAHPGAVPAYAGPDWPALEPEPPLENQVLDLLAWLTFWSMYAIDQYHSQHDNTKPVIGNFDYQQHPLARS